MFRKIPFTAVAAALTTALLAAAPAAHAADRIGKAVYDGAKDDLRQYYKDQRKLCDSMSGNTKDVCAVTTRGQERIAMAHLEVAHTGRDSDRVKLYEARYNARYDIANEKCDDLSGNPKDVCRQQAKAERDKAKADLTLAKKVTAATEEAMEANLRADYKVAREKCDALSGDAKDICQSSAKARFDLE